MEKQTEAHLVLAVTAVTNHVLFQRTVVFCVARFIINLWITTYLIVKSSHTSSKTHTLLNH